MSSYLVIENFQGGLDTRKARLAAPAGTLTEGLDGHITPGGEFEKRKAFVPLANPDAGEADSLVPNTFGLQPVANGLMVFGSADLSAAQWPNDADGNAIQYQRLQHPAVLAGEVYSAGSHAMTAVVHSEVYEGKAFVIAQYADGRRFCYYDGTLVSDFTSGLVLPYLAGNNRKIATHMKGLVDALDDYSAARVGPYATTHRAHAGTTATLTIGAHSIQIGEKVWVTGMSANYNVSGVAITGKTATTISYTTVGSLTEGTTADATGTVESAIVDITGAAGVDYSVTAQNDTAAGTVAGPTNTVSAVAPVAGVSASGSFTITGGSEGVAPTAATGTITRTATNAAAGDYIQIGKKKYTFRATPTVEGDVKIGATAGDSLTNLKNAINHSGTPGTDYMCAWAHPWVVAGVIAGNNLPLTANKGSHGNSIVLTESTVTARFSVSGATLTGGAGNCIGSIKVVSPTGTETELLAAAVAFTINVSATAAAVRDAIVANSGTSGYTATINENTVTVLSAATANPMPNGYHLQVGAGGNVLVGECLFYLTQQAASFTLNTILVDGLDCLAGAEVFPQTGSTGIAVDTLPEYYAELVYIINSRAGITGINAWSNGEYVKVSRITTRDDDQALAVYITPAAANTVGIVFGNPPELALPLKVTLPDAVPAVGGIDTTKAGFGAVLGADVIATVTGGNGLFTYQWIAEYPGSETGNLPGAQRYVVNDTPTQPPAFGVATYLISLAPSNTRGTRVVFSITAATFYKDAYLDIYATTVRYAVRCRVTDSFGNTALSNPCQMEFQIT